MSINILRNYPSIKMADLEVNLDFGWAYQKDYVPYIYDLDYWENYCKLEDTPIAKELNKFRTSLATSYSDVILDIGIGNGAFLKNLNCIKYGHDVNPYAEKWLKEKNMWHNPLTEDNKKINGFCFWDVLEHYENPCDILAKIPKNAFVFISMPIFTEITKVHLSKHYKPNEHLQYFTTQGMIKFLDLCDIQVKEIRSDESVIGRENILSFVGKKIY